MARTQSEDEKVDDKDDSTAVAVEGNGEEPAEPLTLDVQVTSPSACERHVTVTIAREDIDRYFDDAFGEMMPTAAVPGFRIGRAPRVSASARMSSPSELTHTESTPEARLACSMDQASSGSPQIDTRFLRGMPLDPARAGMMATVIPTLVHRAQGRLDCQGTWLRSLTAIGTSSCMYCRPFSTTIIVPSSR